MALQPFVTAEELSKLEPAMKSLYPTADASGRYVLDVAPRDGFALENVHGLKTAYEREQAERKRIEMAAKNFDGLDAAAAREALAKVGEMKNWKPDDKVREMMAAREKELADKFQTDLAPFKQRDEKQARAIDRLLREARGIAAINAKKGSVELLKPIVMGALRTVEDPTTGDYRLQVIAPDGRERITTDKNGQPVPMTEIDLLEELAKNPAYAPAFQGSGQSGSGKGGGDKTGVAGPTTISASDVAAISANIPEIASGKVKVVA